MDLSDFLLARIAEDEAVARMSLGRAWEPITDNHGRGMVEHSVWAESSDPGPSGEYVAETVRSRTTAEHIARHDPARVLAECEAERRIVAEARDSLTSVGGYIVTDDAWSGRQDAYEEVLRLLALPYADHPDYRSEWKP